jgi:hypothetical protein
MPGLVQIGGLPIGRTKIGNFLLPMFWRLKVGLIERQRPAFMVTHCGEESDHQTLPFEDCLMYECDLVRCDGRMLEHMNDVDMQPHALEIVSAHEPQKAILDDLAEAAHLSACERLHSV